MKSDIEKRIPYFSAYPLKALNLPEEEYQSELNLRKETAPKTVLRTRILPMTNPYKQKDFGKTDTEVLK